MVRSHGQTDSSSTDAATGSATGSDSASSSAAPGGCKDRKKPIECTSCKEFNICLAGKDAPEKATRCDSASPYCKIDANSDSCSPTIDPFNQFCKDEPERFNCLGGPDSYPG